VAFPPPVAKVASPTSSTPASTSTQVRARRSSVRQARARGAPAGRQRSAKPASSTSWRGQSVPAKATAGCAALAAAAWDRVPASLLPGWGPRSSPAPRSPLPSCSSGASLLAALAALTSSGASLLSCSSLPSLPLRSLGCSSLHPKKPPLGCPSLPRPRSLLFPKRVAPAGRPNGALARKPSTPSGPTATQASASRSTVCLRPSPRLWGRARAPSRGSSSSAQAPGPPGGGGGGGGHPVAPGTTQAGAQGGALCVPGVAAPGGGPACPLEPRRPTPSPRRTSTTVAKRAAPATPKAPSAGAERELRKASSLRPASLAPSSVSKASFPSAATRSPVQRHHAKAPRTRSLKTRPTRSPARATHALQAAAVRSARSSQVFCEVAPGPCGPCCCKAWSSNGGGGGGP